MNAKKITIGLIVLLLAILAIFAGYKKGLFSKKTSGSKVMSTKSSLPKASTTNEAFRSFEPALYITPTPQPALSCGSYTKIRGRIDIPKQTVSIIDTNYMGENYCPQNPPYESPNVELKVSNGQGKVMFQRNIEAALYTPYDYIKKEDGEFGGGVVEEKYPYFETYIKTLDTHQHNYSLVITGLDSKSLLGKTNL